MLALARAEFDDTSVVTSRDLAGWVEHKTPTLVVHDETGGLIGYARAKPNQAFGVSRSDGQTAILAHIAVVPEHRGVGIGRSLHDRTLRTLAMLGFSRVFAQVPDDLSSWYKERGWTVHPPGEVVAWVEPPNVQDDELMPSASSRTFSPILCMEFLPRYPVLAERWIGDARPLLNWTLDGRASPELLQPRVGEALAGLLTREPDLAARLPQALCDAVVGTDAESPLARTLLALGR
ncbi:GNAT family N-acetyltransferase [Microbacterium ureisolvens]|uniref:GNAT family N-acetyltransferase n=1 Tax=Microbacterium ureisolvens TaxID=2781186 RepID=A0ABS7HZ40_9MICO|nr:GNAT family N-acetyltransferase [Microbacterium ureisolvens]MBW9110664.1 GNAT family N-acetyltransferase [Microbacterium ureisolvens]